MRTRNGNGRRVSCGVGLCSLAAGTLLLASCANHPDGVQAASKHQLKPLEVLRFDGKHAHGTLSVALAADSRQLISSGEDQTTRVWDISTGRESRRFSGAAYRFQDFAVAPDNAYILAPTPRAEVRYWTLINGRDLRQFTGAHGGPLTVALSADGTLAAGAGGDTLQVWDVSSGHTVRQFPIKSRVIRLSFAGPGGDLVSAESDGRVCHWPSSETAEPACFIAGKDSLRQAAFTRDGNTAVVVTQFGAIEIWNMATQLNVGHLDILSNDVVSLALSPDGTQALLGCADKTVRLWDLATRKQLAQVRGSGSYISCVTFSPDGAAAAFGSDDGEVAMWKLR